MFIDNITEALTICQKLIGSCYSEENENELIKILENTKGCLKSDNSIAIYRPYFSAAFYLKAFVPRGGIIKAQGTDGVEWEAINNQIKRLAELQKLEDCQLSCIPDCYSADRFLNVDQHCFSVLLA
jgi:hypothetical protein